MMRNPMIQRMMQDMMQDPNMINQVNPKSFHFFNRLSCLQSLVMLCNIISCYVIFYYVIICHVLLCYDMLHHVIFCYVMTYLKSV